MNSHGIPYYLELIWVLAKTDFWLRYHGSFLGYFWALLKPLLQFLVMYMVFSVFINVNIPHYQLYLLIGIIIWNFFVEATLSGTAILGNKIYIIKKIYFPRIILVIANTLTYFLGFLCNLLILGVFISLSSLSLSFITWFSLLYIPILFFLALGTSLLLAALYVYFRDIIQIWDVLLQVGFWLTPIVYNFDRVPEQYRSLLLLNPITIIIIHVRQIILENTVPDPWQLVVIITGVLIILFSGMLLFHRSAKVAAERL